MMKCIIVFFLLIISVNIHAQNSIRDITNPYASVSWNNHGQYKYSLHNHTTVSDGAMTPAELINEYKALGYSIVAITDHDDGRESDGNPPDRTSSNQGVITWPWTDYGVDPDEVGIVAVQGNEVSSDDHHIGSYFNDYLGMVNFVNTIMEEIGLRGGLATFCHPGQYRHLFSYYYYPFLDYSHLVGLEIITRNDRYPQDRELWDELLMSFMPDRPIWGFGSDDVHVRSQMDNNWNVMLLPELNDQEVRRAKENGNFYVVSRVTIDDVTGEPPAISSINHSRESGVIEIVAERANTISWLSEGNVVHTGSSYNYRECGAVGSYFRAVITGDGGEVFTQPFGVHEEGLSVKDVEYMEINPVLNIFPNPFNPVTTINYRFSKDSDVSLGVYDVRGNLVEKIYSGFKNRGTYTLNFDGSKLSSGVYFVRFKAGSAVLNKKVLLLK